jgi:hypothetical protein
MWCVGEINEEYRARMYDLLELYALPHNEKEPVICMDEKSKQLLGNVRKSLPGKVLRVDYEYKRYGMRNIFMCVQPLGGKRFVQVTKRRTKQDFAMYIKTLVDDIYPKADKIKLVVDNLNTHFAKSFYETFAKEEAARILARLEFHYTPKHASWLNMAEIEIGIMDRQVLKNRRIPSETELRESLDIWQNNRNEQGAKITWSFSKQDADNKLSKHFT